MLSQPTKSIFCAPSPMDSEIKPRINLPSAYLLATAASSMNAMDHGHGLIESNLPIFGDLSQGTCTSSVSAAQLQSLLANSPQFNRLRTDLTATTTTSTMLPGVNNANGSPAVHAFNLFDMRDNLFRWANGVQNLNTIYPLDATPTAAATTKMNTNVGTTSNFALTSFVTSALTANASLGNNQILNACAPLLQLAIRQAIAECLPDFQDLEIQGNLKIMGGKNSNGPYIPFCSTIIEFNNKTQNSTDNEVPTKIENSPGSNSSETNHSHSGSRRKPVNPSRLPIDDSVNGTLSVSPQNPTSPFLRSSGPNSPSTDSGVLDLSRAGSLAGSAPITPMKSLSLSADPTQSDMHLHEQSLVDAYKKQLAAFDQIQNLWRFAVGKPECISTVAVPSISTRTDQSSVVRNPQSEPNSPVKVNRRNRTMVGTSGRLNAMRKPSSTRRFPCNQCREEFPSLHTLEEHTVYQHGTYRCHICKAQFTQRSNLQRHALKHVGFKPFECRVCAKAYYRKDHLMRHMEMGHPGFAPRDNITVRLTSSESLDFLNRSGNVQPSPNDLNEIDHMDSSQDSNAEPGAFDVDSYFSTTTTVNEKIDNFTSRSRSSSRTDLNKLEDEHSDSSAIVSSDSKYQAKQLIDNPNFPSFQTDSAMEQHRVVI